MTERPTKSGKDYGQKEEIFPPQELVGVRRHAIETRRTLDTIFQQT